MKTIVKILMVTLLLPCVLFGQDKGALPFGGIEKFIDDLKSKTSMSEEDLLTKFDFEFTVSEIGKLDTFRFIKSNSDSERDLIAKTIVDLGNWIPAMKNGKEIRSVVRFPSHLMSDSYIKDRISGIESAVPEVGLEAFQPLFLKGFRYPDAAIKAGISGTFTLKFIVKEDGTLTNIKLEKDPGYEIAESAIRALKRAGKWRPARLNGNYLKTESSFDFTLSLKEFRRHI